MNAQVLASVSSLVSTSLVLMMNTIQGALVRSDDHEMPEGGTAVTGHQLSGVTRKPLPASYLHQFLEFGVTA